MDGARSANFCGYRASSTAAHIFSKRHEVARMGSPRERSECRADRAAIVREPSAMPTNMSSERSGEVERSESPKDTCCQFLLCPFYLDMLFHGRSVSEDLKRTFIRNFSLYVRVRTSSQIARSACTGTYVVPGNSRISVYTPFGAAGTAVRMPVRTDMRHEWRGVRVYIASRVASAVRSTVTSVSTAPVAVVAATAAPLLCDQ